VQGLDVDAVQITRPLDDIVDPVEIMLGSGDENSPFKEMALEQVFPFCTTMSRWCADTGHML